MQTLQKTHSLAEYFEREIGSETKNEYIKGEIVPMTGGTPTHNRIIIAEVLSPSTANYDRTDKFAYYRTIPTKEGDRWIFDAYASDATIPLKSVEATIATKDLYNRINFESEMPSSTEK